MKTHFVAAFLILIVNISLGQSRHGDDYISWSPARKLTVDDFVIKTNDLKTTPSFAQFFMGFEVKGFDFMTKNFNKKVNNHIIKSASWIDTTYDIAESLKYQQTLWDMCEIYARHFRKELKENRKKIASGTEFIKVLNAKVMSDFSKRRIQYDSETKFGTLKEKQTQWELQIQKELDELKEFARE
jgi:hypothetical protein